MKLSISNRDQAGVSVLHLGGRIILGEESNALRSEIMQLLDADSKKILLNLSEVTYVDSSGVGTLVAAHAVAEKHGARIKLTNLSDKFQEALQITRLVTVLDTYDNESDALKSFE